jgi:hypothetical protein
LKQKDGNAFFDRNALWAYPRRSTGFKLHEGLSPRLDHGPCSRLAARHGQEDNSQIETTERQQQPSEEVIDTGAYGPNQCDADAMLPHPPHGISEASTMEEPLVITSRMHEHRDHRYHLDDPSSPTHHTTYQRVHCRLRGPI